MGRRVTAGNSSRQGIRPDQASCRMDWKRKQMLHCWHVIGGADASPIPPVSPETWLESAVSEMAEWHAHTSTRVDALHLHQGTSMEALGVYQAELGTLHRHNWRGTAKELTGSASSTSLALCVVAFVKRDRWHTRPRWLRLTRTIYHSPRRASQGSNPSKSTIFRCRCWPDVPWSEEEGRD